MTSDTHANQQIDLKLLYIGSVLPDRKEFFTSAFSRAGTMFQLNLLLGLKHAGLIPSSILSYLQIRSFPGSGQLWLGSCQAMLPENMPVSLLPFVNVTPIKQISLGVITLFRILKWGWHHRLTAHKVIYTFNLTVPPGIFTLVGARLIGAKAVDSLNDINIPGQTVPNSFFNRVDFFLQRKIIPLFDGHVSVSDRIMEDFAPGRQFVRLEGGVTAEMLHKPDAAGRNPWNKTSRFTIVSAGSLDEANGFKVLLEAFSQLQGDQYRLFIAGGGPLSSEVQKAAELDTRISYYGFIPFAEVLALYRSANVLINMRLTKTLDTKYFFPSKMMEYLASGTPVISTCTGHVESDFGDFVFLLRDETATSLAEMIRQVKSLDPSLLAERGLKAQAYMEKNKTWDAHGRKVADFIKSLFINTGRKDD